MDDARGIRREQLQEMTQLLRKVLCLEIGTRENGGGSRFGDNGGRYGESPGPPESPEIVTTRAPLRSCVESCRKASLPKASSRNFLT